MEEYAHDDPRLEEYAETLEPYVGQHKARGVPYQVFIHNNELVGYVVMAEEPVRLIEPIGTPMSIVVVVDYSTPIKILQEFADNALRIAQEHNAVYSFIDVPTEHDELVKYFIDIGYAKMAHSLRMKLDLADYEKESSSLRFVMVEREQVRDFIDALMKFMNGTPDNMIVTIFRNITGLPEQFLDYWYNSTSLNFVYDEDELVGILDLHPKGINIANIGVSPEHRGKGYGRKIMHYAFTTLKERGDDQAILRVHAENKRAIGLYESLGMKYGRSFQALIWRK